MTKKNMAIAIPASVISDTPHLREKTSKIGCIARAAAIFRVEEIIIYADNPKVNQKKEIDLISTLLSYMETPQYLRKQLFEIKPELKYAGILPPLRTPHHPIQGKMKDLKDGEIREGLAVSRKKEGTMIEIGVENLVLLPNAAIQLNKRLTVKIRKSKDRISLENVDSQNVPEYWGYTVSVESNSLSALLENRKFDLTVGTSKFATLFPEVEKKINAEWAKANKILVLFGSPTRGLFEIAKDIGKNINEMVDFVLNTVPNQGTETVRTEEALFATLAILNLTYSFIE